jgi:hypothetical protein
MALCHAHQLRFLNVLMLTLISTIVLVFVVGKSLSPGEILTLCLANVAVAMPLLLGVYQELAVTMRRHGFW